MSDTAAELANLGIIDENLVDHVITTLTDEGAVHWQDLPSVYVGPLNLHGGLSSEDLHRIVTVAVIETAERIAEDIEGQRDDLDVIGHTADAVRGAYTDAATIARALAAYHGAEALR